MGPLPATILTPQISPVWLHPLPVSLIHARSDYCQHSIADASKVPYRPATPPSEASSPAHESPEYVGQRDLSDVDYNEDRAENLNAEAPKKGGYDARVEQWLYEQRDQLIIITGAGKDGVNYIQYTINCGVGGLIVAYGIILSNTGP